MHHPFTGVASLERVEGSLQVCLAGVIMHQPGLVARDTQFGQGEVCNAVVRQNETDIRCSFWRSQGAALADYTVGSAVALMQVNVCRHGGSFEVRATEATQVLACPADVEATALAGTDGDAPASVQSASSASLTLGSSRLCHNIAPPNSPQNGHAVDVVILHFTEEFSWIPMGSLL